MRTFVSSPSIHRHQLHRHTKCLMDIFILGLLCMVSGGHSAHIPSAERSQNVRLVPNSFQIIIQNSLPTSLPPASKKSSKISSFSSVISPYQADEGYKLGWPLQEVQENERDITACDKSCPYGLEADIEGNELCKCKDPCKGVECFGGMKCEPKKECLFDQCHFTAVCKANDVCLLPKPKFTFMCEKLSKRYYYDLNKGLCRKFWGCAEIVGNSFDNKKECKKSCYSKEEKRRDRKDRGPKKDELSQVSSEMTSNEMSNVVPKYNRLPSLNSKISEDLEETHNHIESNAQSPYSMLTQQVPGLNQLTGCPKESPYEFCPFDPCTGCNNANIMCFTSFCGKCQAIYIDLRSGKASQEFAAIC